jgi:glycerol-3-phosphate acyltransferase PlsY
MNSILLLLLCMLLAYLAGSIPFGYLIARAKGVDIRKLGSGNIGGTNIGRNFGFKWGALVGVLDFTKCFILAFLAYRYIPVPWQALLVSIMPVFGHIFPVWLKFKGGKGVSTIFGILMVYMGGVFFLIWLAVWYGAVKLVRLMSLVNLVAASVIPVLFWLFYRDWLYVGFGAVLCLLIWWSHRENIKRLLAGTENPLNY